MMLLPDERIADVSREEGGPNARKGAVLGFAHGFNIHYGQVAPRADLDVMMVAPKAPGHTVRSTFVSGGGVPHLLAAAQNPSGSARDVPLPYTAAIGRGRSYITHTPFPQSTTTH